MKLFNRVAIVTGAGQGIGRAIALRFAREGADIVIPDINRETAEQTANSIRQLGRRAISVEADVSKSDQVRSFVTSTLQQFGQIDILVNNAGIRQIKPFIEMTDEEWQREIDVDLTGTFFCIREVAAPMIQRGKGRIINNSSIAGFLGHLNRAAYCAAKEGLLTLTKAIALELADKGITVNAIAPGWTLTGMSRREDDGALETVVPIGRRGKPEEIAEGVLYLASDEASFTNGTTVAIDGGTSAGLKI